MKILHVAPTVNAKGGGTTAAIVGLTRAQKGAGLDVRIAITPAAKDDLRLADELRREGIIIDQVEGQGRLYRNPGTAAMVERAARDADVVHIHAVWEEIQHRAARACQSLGKPYLVRPAGMLDPWSFNTRGKWKKRLLMMLRVRRNLDRAAAIHFTTAMERDMTQSHMRLKPPAIVEPNGVQIAEFEKLPDPKQFRDRFPQLGSRRYIAFMGRLDGGKGLELLIPAFAESKLAADDVKLVVVGPDWRGGLERFTNLAQEHGVKEHVIFTGMLTGADRIAALAGADIFSLPSYHENFGIAVAEALASGVPVVVSDQVYCHPDVTQAKVGAVVPLDVSALAKELRRWMDDAALRNAAAVRARPFAFEQYDWNKIALRWRGHYESLLK